WAPLSAVGLILLKAVLILVLGLVFKLSRGAAVELGLLLGQGGEFAFVIFAAALQGNILSADVAEFMLLVTGLSMVLTPPIAAFAG
ncbi:cation:proton antiporter domain-containing protein, partial [Enterococcus faecium]